MNTHTRNQLVREGRTHWFCVKLDDGSRFGTNVFCWARDEADARARIIAARGAVTITAVKEQHR